MYKKALLVSLLAMLSWFGAHAQNNALNFDGTDDYVSCGTFNLSSQSITYECWFKVDAFQASSPYISTLMGIESGGTNDALLRIVRPDSEADDYRLQYVYNESVSQASITGTTTLQTGVWYHAAAVYDNTVTRSVTLYLNGVQEAFDSGMTTSFDANASFNISRSFGGRYLDGQMDEVRIWNDIRTETEIRQNMYQELTNPAGEGNLVAYYKFNQTSGTSLPDSKNSNDGTLTNYGSQSGYWQTSPAMFGPKNCLDFDGGLQTGSPDYASKSSNVTSVTDNFTMMAWVKPDVVAQGTNGWRCIAFNGDDAGGYGIGISNTKVAGLFGTVSWLETSEELSVGNWYHITMRRSGGTTQFFLNGKLLSFSSSSTPNAVTANFSIGNMFISGTSIYTDSFDGQIEEVCVFSAALDDHEIREYMCKSLTGNESDLVAYYNFDNSSGNVLQSFDGATSNDLTLVNTSDDDWVSSSAFNTWLNTSSSDWSTVTNWSRGSAPASDGNVGIYNFTNEPNIPASQTIGSLYLGTGVTTTMTGNMTVNGGLILDKNLDISTYTVTLGSSACLFEDGGTLSGTSGQIQTTRSLSNIDENVAGLGAEITTTANMGSTTITRTRAAASNPASIKRRYDISPTTNTGLNATLVFHYNDDELNGLTESSIRLLRSTDGGTNWDNFGGFINTTDNTITRSAVDAFSSWTAGVPESPIIETYNPSQNYFSGTAAVIIAPAVTITSTQDITVATVSVSPVVSGDVLSVSGLPGDLSSSWDNTTKILTISGTGSAANYQTVLQNVKFESTSTTSSTRTIDFNLGGGIGLTIGGQKHFYEVIGDGVSSITWTTARANALNNIYTGQSGYLTTIMSAEENNYLKDKVTEDTWIGASDAAAEGIWKWMDGPEAGTQFWSGGSGGSSVGENYVHWWMGEPNNASNEDYAHMRGSATEQWGYWNDYADDNTSAKYYITEYGGDGTIFTTMDDATVVVQTDLTWDGSETTDWDTPGNWNQDVAPNAYLKLVIPDLANDPIIGIDIDASCNDLTINAEASLTIQSTASGTGSLIVNGTATGDVRVERYIGEWSDDHGWHFLSSPVESQDISDEFVDVETIPISSLVDFYRWSESEGLWINIKNGDGDYNQGSGETYFSNDDSPLFTTGKGYLIAYASEQTKTFSGSLRTTDYDVTGLTYTSGKDYAGWHLLGNPFSSALDFNAGTWNKSDDIGAYAQIWNETAASYKVLRTEQNIPAMNGFMVYTYSDGGSLTIPTDARLHSDSNWYKSTINEDMIVLTAIDNQTHTSQETVINFNAEATDDFDLKYDSYFMAGYAPMFYTTQYNKNYALNCLPQLIEGLTVQLGFIKNNSTEFTIKLTESSCDYDIYITDTKQNKTQNLSLNPVYIFTAFEQDDHDRFVIHFSPLGIDEPTTPQELIQIWASNKTINILNTNNYVGDIKVMNMFGQTVLSTKLTGDKNQKLVINAPSGYYIINTITQKGVINKKVYLR